MLLDHHHLHISRPWPGCLQWWFLFVWPASEIFSSSSPLFSTGNNDDDDDDEADNVVDDVDVDDFVAGTCELQSTSTWST